VASFLNCVPMHYQHEPSIRFVLDPRQIERDCEPKGPGFDLNWNKKFGTDNTADSTISDGGLFKALGFALNLQLSCRASSPEFSSHDPFAFNLDLTSFFVFVSIGRWSNLHLCSRTRVSVVKSVPGPCRRGVTT
jgi:hypothetical protein